MKNVSVIAILLIALTIITSSCYSSRSKTGCPGNPQSNYRFRG